MADELTHLMRRMSAGDPAASEAVWSTVYDQLRAIARHQMVTGPKGASLHPTMLVNEAWLKLAGKEVAWSDRKHFFLLASQVMRSVLVDAARRRGAAKRGGDLHLIDVEIDLMPGGGTPFDILELDETLQRLAVHSARMAKIVELRVFGGLDHAECAESLGCSLRSVESDWHFAKVWLYSELAP
ncbi:ECF-type sigma factor [Saltatorellus ferox]|uniref:ECF-type sigma factor n=1 Tax=Saltatorellus ferox TaxID=2528018 RepID=UPI003AF3B708